MRTLILCCMALLMPATALAATTEITVTGEGTASAMPDMATETFTISTNALTATTAVNDNNTRYNRLVSAMQGIGVPSADLKTTSYNLNYSPPPSPAETSGGGPRERYGYFVYRTIEVTLRRTNLVGKAIDTAVASGVTDIGGVTFGVSDRKGQLATALRSAVSDARMQAETMAGAAGLHVVRMKQMQQGYQIVPPPAPVMMQAKMASAQVPTQIEPSSVEARASVTITYIAQ